MGELANIFIVCANNGVVIQLTPYFPSFGGFLKPLLSLMKEDMKPWLPLGEQRDRKRVRLAAMADANKQPSSSFLRAVVLKCPSMAPLPFAWLGAKDES